MNIRIACLIFFTFLISLTASAQPSRSSIGTGTEVNLQREIKLEGKSGSEVVIVKVEEQVNAFELAITSSVTAGTLGIEVYDPQGNSHGNFSVGTQLKGENIEEVHGRIARTLKNPESGNWKVKVLPGKATGKVVIQTSFSY